MAINDTTGTRNDPFNGFNFEVTWNGITVSRAGIRSTGSRRWTSGSHGGRRSVSPSTACRCTGSTCAAPARTPAEG